MTVNGYTLSDRQLEVLQWALFRSHKDKEGPHAEGHDCKVVKALAKKGLVKNVKTTPGYYDNDNSVYIISYCSYKLTPAGVETAEQLPKIEDWL
jgi:hypothetical protein